MVLFDLILMLHWRVFDSIFYICIETFWTVNRNLKKRQKSFASFLHHILTDKNEINFFSEIFSLWYLFESVHTENRPIVGFDGLHQEHVPPDTDVPGACAWKHHLLCPAIHSAHHGLCFPHAPLAPNETTTWEHNTNSQETCHYEAKCVTMKTVVRLLEALGSYLLYAKTSYVSRQQWWACRAGRGLFWRQISCLCFPWKKWNITKKWMK